MSKNPITITLSLSTDQTEISSKPEETIFANIGQAIEFSADSSFTRYFNHPESKSLDYWIKVYNPSAASAKEIRKVTQECGKNSTEAILNILQDDPKTHAMNLRIVIHTIGIVDTKKFTHGDQVWFLPSSEDDDSIEYEETSPKNTMNTNSGGIIVRPPE